MHVVVEKIKSCRQALKEWSEPSQGGVRKKVENKMKEVESLLLTNDEGGCNTIAINGLKAEINELLLQDEMHWRQRSRAVWLESGDKNTKFFHQRASQWKKKNTITGLEDDLGVFQEDKMEIGCIMEDYFSSIFNTANPPNIDATTSTLEHVVSPEDNQTLLGAFIAEEVQKAAFQMHPSKVPGPDGMSCFFFQKYWHVIGMNVTQAILLVLNSGHMLKKINYTHIVLIPKGKNPRKVSDFRPISLCNVLYKLLSKVLVNRFQTVLPKIISDTQSAFLPGRLITDNAAVAFELLHSMKMKRTGRTGQLAMKLDMSKAYDRVEWGFLEATMLKMGFAPRWVSLIMECVSTPTYSVMINGTPQGYIKPSRGLRQGDPLSPYLFLICAEGLTSLLRRAERQGLIHGIAANRYGPKISHLLFADNSLLLIIATTEECRQVLSILETYEQAFGQRINREKTSLFFDKDTTTEV